MKSDFAVHQANIEDLLPIINQYLDSLAYPFDSYLEDLLFAADFFSIEFDDQTGGFFALDQDTLQFFYLNHEYCLDSSDIFAKIISDYHIKNALVLSSDPQINALIIEWDYQIERLGCWFTDSCLLTEHCNKLPQAVFRSAAIADAPKIRAISQDFFDEVSGGFNSLEERIDAQTIFVLEEKGILYGCGVIEYGRLFPDYASIGMFVNPSYRQRGAAKTILLKLKEIVYQAGKKPIAGCWYYNTLSRKSMAAAGMNNTVLGYKAKLCKKDNIPMRTGNPPGEAVE